MDKEKMTMGNLRRFEGFKGRMKPSQSFTRIERKKVSPCTSSGKEGFKGFMPSYTEGMKPSFETFPPSFLEAENKAFVTRMKPSKPSPTRIPMKLADTFASWLCPHCGQPATIDDIFPSLDGERTLTMWRCDPCQVVAVTPDAIKKPPSSWIKRTQQQRT
jgi:hypothetical protein